MRIGLNDRGVNPEARLTWVDDYDLLEKHGIAEHPLGARFIAPDAGEIARIRAAKPDAVYTFFAGAAAVG